MTLLKIPLLALHGWSGIPEAELAAEGWDLAVATSVAAAKTIIRHNSFPAGLVLFPDKGEADVAAIEEVVLQDRCIEWLALLPAATLGQPELASFVMDRFYDFRSLPVDPRRLSIILRHVCERGALRRRAGAPHSGGTEIIGTSPAIRNLHLQLQKMQDDEAPVLITGESGTGKELAARAIHQLSSRRNAPFVAVNCGAIPETLVQSELFGFERGAFTGAARRKIGKIESAAGGAILLDEVGDLPLQIQVNLLRFLQEKTIERVGSTRTVPVDVRVIAATNVDLEDAVQKGQFREDLYYRLNVLRLKMPPLRERGNDLELLARTFLEEFGRQKARKAKRLSNKALKAMYDYPWPGNVRELQNRVRRAAVVSEGVLILPGDLGLEDPDCAPAPLSLEQVREQAELAAIRQSLRRNRSVCDSARELGVSRVTLYRLINKFQLGDHLRKME